MRVRTAQSFAARAGELHPHLVAAARNTDKHPIARVKKGRKARATSQKARRARAAAKVEVKRLEAEQAARAIAQAAFLAEFALCGIVLRAAAKAGVGRCVVYGWRKNDPRFEELFQEAVQDAMDRVEEEARRRAVDGWDEEVYQLGGYVGTVRKYDSALMALLLKGRRPEIYRDRVDAKLDADVKHGRLIDPKTSTTEELAARIEEARAALGLLGQFTPAAPKPVEGIVVEAEA